MNRLWISPLIASLLAGMAAAPAHAGMPFTQEMTCPVGGETFSHTSTASYSTFGARLDGKPYGSWIFPLALPVCPSNGLPVYRDFTQEEIAWLETYLASPEFAAIREETDYYRAAEIAARIDTDAPYSSHWLMLRATWEVDYELARKARYQRRFADQVAALPAAPDEIDWLFLTLRAANAYRESGDFAAAAQMFAGWPEDILARTGPAPEGDSYDQEPRQREYLKSSRDDVLMLAAQGNRESEPLATAPSGVAAGLCLDLEEAGQAPLPGKCLEPEVIQMMDRQREDRK